jgi:hypothetical protein
MSKDPENNNLNNEPNEFGLPGNYFERSAGSIINKIEWLDEHKEFPRLAELKNKQGFIVPANYFETCENKLELINYPTLLKQHKQTGFEVPANYFEEAETLELSKVFDDTQELSGFKVLSSLKKENPFTIKENYFDQSQKQILEANTKTARVIGLFSARTLYSAAAAVAAIVIGIWIYSYYFAPVVTGDCGTLACVDKNDIVKSKSLENLDDDQLYEIVDTKKLEEKLEKKEDKKEKKHADTSLNNISTDDLMDEI